jgi:hypothetical protein
MHVLGGMLARVHVDMNLYVRGIVCMRYAWYVCIVHSKAKSNPLYVSAHAHTALKNT